MDAASCIDSHSLPQTPTPPSAIQPESPAGPGTLKVVYQTRTGEATDSRDASYSSEIESPRTNQPQMFGFDLGQCQDGSS